MHEMCDDKGRARHAIDNGNVHTNPATAAALYLLEIQQEFVDLQGGFELI